MNYTLDANQHSNSIVISQPRRDRYDFIVVGAGAAGCVLVSQLARLCDGSVLLVDAGALPTSRTLKIPSAYPKSFGTQTDWRFQTTPQIGLANRKIAWPAGKVMGGSTSMNAMIYLEAHDNDFASWRSKEEDTWSTENVRAAYDELADWMDSLTAEEDGLSTLPLVPELHPRMQTVLDIASRNRFLFDSAHRGFASPTNGIGAYRRLQRNGRRFAAWKLLLAELRRTPTARRESIDLVPGCTVERIEIRDGKAVGIEINLGHERTSISASRGVVLCAGTIQSPRILVSSGVGPADLLRRLQIDCKQDCDAVGSNLQDHMIFPVIYRSTVGEPFPSTPTRDDRRNYAVKRSGVMQLNLAEVGAFFSDCRGNNLFENRSAKPRFQWHITPTHYLEHPERAAHYSYLSVGVTLLNPASRGALRFSKRDDRSTKQEVYESNIAVEIDPRYLQSQDDVSATIEAVQRTRQFFRSSEWSSIIDDEAFPGSKRSDDEAVAIALRRLSSTLFHYVGTCSISDSKDSVCDLRFGVRGVSNLAVCDASSIPDQICGNPQSTVMMMALRLSKWIVGYD